MPCEACHVQFTLFRRKRSCCDCKRFYCSSCLTLSKRQILLCQRCFIFAKRPLLRSDLIHLKPKDLIFYLQSKHISTTGCVEKDELVGLVLSHVQQIDTAGGSGHNNCASPTDGDATNSFENIKQTCQNFFSNITDNISDSFASFETKPRHGTNQRTQTTNDGGPTHISHQPRATTREIPTYASSQIYPTVQSPPCTSTTEKVFVNRAVPQTQDTNHLNNISQPSTSSPSINQTNSHSSESESPIYSNNSTASPHIVNEDVPTNHVTESCCEDEKSDCECSDDEIIASFSEKRSKEILFASQLLAASDPTTSSSGQIYNKSESSSPKLDEEEDGEESSHSSFEELGAIGGISDDSKTATDTNSSNMEQWQVLDTHRIEITDVSDQVNEPAPVVNEQPQETEGLAFAAPQKVKKVTRRRSDSYLNRRQKTDCSEDSPTSDISRQLAVYPIPHESAESDLQDVSMDSQNDQKRNCTRCGKNKSNIRRQVEKLRLKLESSHVSPEIIKHELKAFLNYLEARGRSMDCSDSETAVSSPSGHNTAASQLEPENMDDSEGIHVYASCSGNGQNESRFINLDDFKHIGELENLSVRQLKEILMLHRVDYKGCCEKQELLERVERLWWNRKSVPDVDKLQTDELCKICMDAPIECVILECGHMATCTNCGKVLSECPICRQYIVRVVRFFKA